MDRYSKLVLTVIALALVAIAVQPWTPGVLDRVRPGAAQAQTVTPKYDVSIPKSWGKYVGYSNNNLLRVKVLIRWQ